MVAVQVAPPARKPRAGGIKSVVGEFAREQRLSMGEIAWEDSGCGLPSATRAGCYDITFPLDYQPVDIDDDGATFTFTRNADGTVTVDADFSAAVAPAGFIAPWRPTTAASGTVGGGDVLIATDGAVTYSGTPSGTAQFTYDTTDRTGGTLPPKQFSGVSQYGGIGDAFARYAGVSCYLGGDSDGPSYLDQAKALLASGEDREVEAVLWAWASAAASPGPAATIVAAIADAEEKAAASYVGQPVLIMSRAAATFAAAANVLVGDGGALRTHNGTPVIASGMVPDSEQTTVVAVGWPAVYASDVVAVTTPQITANIGVALAERMYQIGVDCDYRYAVEATAMEGA